MAINSKKLMLTLCLTFSLLQTVYAKSNPSTAPKADSIEQGILVYINQYRQEHGLKPLKMDSHMSSEARRHSQEMANHSIPFGHKYFLSRVERLHKQIKNSGAGAENVAYNYKDAQDVVKNWLKSSGHKHNIDGNYDLTGIGIARDAHGKIYFTQIFLKTGVQTTHVARKSFPNPFSKNLFHFKRSA